jgi:hypothetical protein
MTLTLLLQLTDDEQLFAQELEAPAASEQETPAPAEQDVPAAEWPCEAPAEA